MGFLNFCSTYFIRLGTHLQIKTFTDDYLSGMPSALTPIIFKDQINILKGIKKAMHLF